MPVPLMICPQGHSYVALVPFAYRPFASSSPSYVMFAVTDRSKAEHAGGGVEVVVSSVIVVAFVVVAIVVVVAFVVVAFVVVAFVVVAIVVVVAFVVVAFVVVASVVVATVVVVVLVSFFGRQENESSWEQ